MNRMRRKSRSHLDHGHVIKVPSRRTQIIVTVLSQCMYSACAEPYPAFILIKILHYWRNQAISPTCSAEKQKNELADGTGKARGDA